MPTPNSIIGYHFTGNTLRNGDPIPPVGEWLVHKGDIIPCESGLHASEDPFDALQYAPGNLIHKVELEGELVLHGDPVDKWVGRRRRIIQTADAESTMREFARWCALQVIHMWEAPDIVRRYLETGDESLREASREATGDAYLDAYLDAASSAASSAASLAATEASNLAAMSAATEAAWSNSWSASRKVQRKKWNDMVNALLCPPKVEST